MAGARLSHDNVSGSAMRYDEMRRMYPQIDEYLEIIASQPRTMASQRSTIALLGIRVSQEIGWKHQQAVLAKLERFSRILVDRAITAAHTYPQPKRCTICGSIENNGKVCRWCHN